MLHCKCIYITLLVNPVNVKYVLAGAPDTDCCAPLGLAVTTYVVMVPIDGASQLIPAVVSPVDPFTDVGGS
jgi:hypothetical protein